MLIAEKCRRLNLAVDNSDSYNRYSEFLPAQFNVRRKAPSSQLTQGCDQLTEGCDQLTEGCDQ
jgi:hypothetical protein